MEKLIFTLLTFSVLWFMSCKQSSQDSSALSTKSKSVATASSGKALMPGDTLPLNIQKGGAFRSLDQIRVQARNEIDLRKTEHPEPLSMLTHTKWTPEFVYNAGKMSKLGDYDDHWIKFEDNFTYTYGIKDKTNGKGRYHFRLDDKSLYMVDDNVDMEPKVWTVNHNARVLAFVGTHVFNVNNGMQIKMIPTN